MNMNHACNVPHDAGYVNVCHICGVPLDAGYFDVATINSGAAIVGESSSPATSCILSTAAHCCISLSLRNCSNPSEASDIEDAWL